MSPNQQAVPRPPSWGLQTTQQANNIKEGVLFKQRDFMKGWRPRHFILQDTFLHYFLEADDVVPRASMDISGCNISHLDPKRVGQLEYFPFALTHGSAHHGREKAVYTLASDSRIEADDWVDKIRMAATNAVFHAAAAAEAAASTSTAVHNVRDSVFGGLGECVEHGGGGGVSGAAGGSGVGGGGGGDDSLYVMQNPETTLKDIPEHIKKKLENVVRTMVNAVDPGAKWEPLFEKNGVVARKRPGDVVCVRGDGFLPYDVMDIFKLINTSEWAAEINPQVHESRPVKSFSFNTGM